MLKLEDIRKTIWKKSAGFLEEEKESKQDEYTVPDFELDDDGEEYMGVGVNGLLASSEKLLAINRGLTEPDERDHMKFQKVFSPDSLLRESIKMDAGKVARTMLYRAAKHKNLSGVAPGMFDDYVKRLIVGNPLTSSLEEINPMQLVENARRITKMGPGGLGSSRAITEETQSVHPSQFGFVSVIEGPECIDNQLVIARVYSKNGWISVADITMDTELACRINGKLEFHKPTKVIHEPYEGTMYGVKNSNISFLVTPNHRLYGTNNVKKECYIEYAENVYGKLFKLPTTHSAYEGITKGVFSPDGIHKYDAKDWCTLLGWFLSEGNLDWNKGRLIGCVITQSEDIHPDEFAEIDALATRMQLKHGYRKPSPNNKQGHTKRLGIYFSQKWLLDWFSQYKDGCYNKWIPEEVFDWGVDERQALLDALIKGDGRVNKTHTVYCTVSERLAKDVERLMIGLGYCTKIRIEKDKRPHVKTTNYAVCMLKTKFRDTETNDKRYTPYWYKIDDYKGVVHCATVPGGLLLYSGDNTPGVWIGNSEKAGIDNRVTMGVKLGSNGRLYQQFRDKRTGKLVWLSPADLDGLAVGIPS